MNQTEDKTAAPGSLAEIDGRLDQEDAGTPVLASLPAATAFVTLGVASDHLRATYPLIVNDKGEVSVMRYSVYSVMRVAMEVAALVWWLVEEGVSAKTRLTRALTLMEDSRSQRQVSERRVGGDGTDLHYLQAIRESVELTARTLRLQRITSRLDAGREVRAPDAIDLIRLQFSQASDGAEGDAAAIYGMMSEPMHGSILGTMMGFDPPSASTGPLIPGVSTPHLVSAAHVTGFAVASAMTVFVSYMGWDPTPWLRIANPAMDDLEQAIRTVKMRRPVEERLRNTPQAISQVRIRPEAPDGCGPTQPGW